MTHLCVSFSQSEQSGTIAQMFCSSPGRVRMDRNDETMKLYASAYDDDVDEREDAEFDGDLEDEEEEEELTVSDSRDDEEDEPVATSTHSEDAVLFAVPATPVSPYTPPTRISEEPVAAPMPVESKAPAKKAPAKKKT